MICKSRFPARTSRSPARSAAIGLLERENAAILNACLRPLARETVAAFRQAIADLGITAPLYLTQNDGTLMSADFAEQYPVLTFASGPTNSMRGAAFLSGLKDAMVVDVGGTTSRRRRADARLPAGSVGRGRYRRRAHQLPDARRLLVRARRRLARAARTRCAIGPQSVGYRMTAGGAGLRRRHADDDRHRRRGGCGRHRRRGTGRASRPESRHSGAWHASRR